MLWLTMEGPVDAVVIGARGGIGEAFTEALAQAESVRSVYATSRDARWAQGSSSHPKVERALLDISDETSLSAFADGLARAERAPRVVLNCSGLLHDGELRPERTWRELNAEHMARSFAVNAIGPALAIKHLVKAVPRRQDALFITLSARVGSITDNRLGGWYSYRASKAAQNMIVKTASIEAANRYPKLIICAMHPGTVATELSEPFTKRLARGHVVFSPEESCRHLCEVIGGLTPSDSGALFAWDGARIPW
uniref:Dehydrogenase n=1 Tax=uncultured bacterium HF186_25m_30B18 TaxID=662885 RepID=C7FPA9_9BACT|nr:dehydrogenase [uncultured bacterium HF186_25m_30B18]